MQNSIAFMRQKLLPNSFGHWLHGYDGELQNLSEQSSQSTDGKQKYAFSETDVENESENDRLW